MRTTYAEIEAAWLRREWVRAERARRLQAFLVRHPPSPSHTEPAPLPTQWNLTARPGLTSAAAELLSHFSPEAQARLLATMVRVQGGIGSRKRRGPRRKQPLRDQDRAYFDLKARQPAIAYAMVKSRRKRNPMHARMLTREGVRRWRSRLRSRAVPGPGRDLTG